MDGLADRYLTNFDVHMVYRTDRFGRGGDQVEMLKAGFPAVRVTEANENYTRQHQDLRTENGVRYGDVIEGVDFAYLAQVTRLNVDHHGGAGHGAGAADRRGDRRRGLRRHHGASGSRRRTPRGYRVWWRDTTDPQWRYSRDGRRRPARRC